MAALIGGIVTDAEELLLHEVTMAKLEVQDELRKTKTAAVSVGVGIGIAAVGALLLILMLVHLLHVCTAIPLWGCYGSVGGVLAGVGVGFFIASQKAAEKIELAPRQAVETLKENAQ